MNQILSTEGTKKGNKVSMHTIVMFFAISMIIFGICLVATSSYAVYKNQIAKEQVVAVSKPEINVNDNGDGTLTIVATHIKGIENIVYNWNDEEKIEISGDKQISKSETVSMPSGTNTLYVTATATNGQSIVFQKEYSSGDSIQIDFSVEGTTIKATLTAETEISYVTYKIDDGEEQRQDINAQTGEVTIQIPEGDHTITVIAVDINNNTQTKTQAVKGVIKPKLKVTQDGENFVVRVSDETGLDKVEFILNGNGYRVRLEGVTEKEFKYPLEDGENTLQVTVYNTSGETESFNALCRK